MIPRYSLPEMTALFSDANRFARYLEVELLVVEAWEELGVAPSGAAQRCRDRSPSIDQTFVEAVSARELVTNHDVAAFVDVVQGAIGGPDASWIHYGLTSSDVVDTSWCSLLTDAADLILTALDDLLVVTIAMAHEHRHTVCIGRTHGMHAEPTTFGAKLALWSLQLDRDRTRFRGARAAVAVGKLSGAVGTYSNIDPRIESFVCARLGLTPTPATQVVARDRHAQYLYACASLGSTIELIAVELRHLQRTEVAEVQEGFSAGQKGSSAMPHKRNPISAETLTGLSRVLRGNLLAGLENVALWHERDISHSSTERVVLPDSSLLAHYGARRLARLLRGLQVFPERMQQNLDSTRGLVFSQPALLALVEAGRSRDDAYRIVQDAASKAWSQGLTLRSLLSEHLDEGTLDRVFDLQKAIEGVDHTINALEHIGG